MLEPGFRFQPLNQTLKRGKGIVLLSVSVWCLNLNWVLATPFINHYYVFDQVMIGPNLAIMVACET
jgi:hypothetical protein